MRVIKLGKLIEKIVTCTECNTKFAYTKKDIDIKAIYSQETGQEYIDVVKCPLCETSFPANLN